MPFTVADRVAEASTTTGTGDFTLAGALTGYQTWSAALDVNDTAYYLIEAVDGSGVATGEWEVGVGKLTGTTTLHRVAVITSTNSDAAVSFAAGTKHVHLSAPARQLQFTGGLWQLSADLTAQNFTTATAIGWTQESFSTEFVTPFHDTVTNNTRITLDGDRYADSTVRLRAQIALALDTANEVVTLRIKDDLGTIIGALTAEANVTSPILQLCSLAYRMSTTTRYFEVTVQTAADASVTVVSGYGQSWVELEVLQ